VLHYTNRIQSYIQLQKMSDASDPVSQVNILIQAMDEDQRKEIMDFHGWVGVKARKSKSKKSSTQELSKNPFNPDMCHARCWEIEKHENGVPVYTPEEGTIHLGCFDFQCPLKKMDGSNLCAKHYKPDCKTHKCKQTNQLFMGTFDKPKPKNPVRISKNGKHKKHTYVWSEDMDESYAEYVTDLDSLETKKTKKTEKSKIPKPEIDFEAIDWKTSISSREIVKLKKPFLKSYLEKFGLDIRGNKPDLIKRIIVHFKSSEGGEEVEIVEQVADEDEAEADEEESDARSCASDEGVGEDEDEGRGWEDEDEDEELEEENYDTVNIQGIEYEINDDYIYDIETKVRLGKMTENPMNSDWEKSKIQIHKNNIVALMSEQ
jgi:hypothetical protein